MVTLTALIALSLAIQLFWWVKFELRWFFGWRPEILDSEILHQTTHAMAQDLANGDAQLFRQHTGESMGAAEFQKHAEEIKSSLRTVIESYILNFSRRS